MSLRLPSEIVAERFVPTIRALLAVKLDERGLTQQEIADHLGVTQAAVSNHINGAIELEDVIVEHPRTRETVDRVAAGLADGSLDDVDALSELLDLVHEFEDRGPICELHEEEMPALAGLGCDLCVRGAGSDVLAERDVLASVRRAARRLESDHGVAEHVPNVGTNVGTALPGATDATDVAAVPGRIYRLRGNVVVPSNPEFGASEHVAGTILAATAVDPAIRGAVNLATDDDLLEAARERGLEPMEFDPDYEDRRERLVDAFTERGAIPRVCYHRGAFGIEPITYVFGETAVEAVDLALSLIDDVAR